MVKYYLAEQDFKIEVHFSDITIDDIVDKMIINVHHGPLIRTFYIEYHLYKVETTVARGLRTSS